MCTQMKSSATAGGSDGGTDTGTALDTTGHDLPHTHTHSSVMHREPEGQVAAHPMDKKAVTRKAMLCMPFKRNSLPLRMASSSTDRRTLWGNPTTDARDTYIHTYIHTYTSMLTNKRPVGGRESC